VPRYGFAILRGSSTISGLAGIETSLASWFDEIAAKTRRMILPERVLGISNTIHRNFPSIIRLHLGQMAAGPNMTMVMLMGYRISGGVGAIAVGFAFFLPDCVLTLAAVRLAKRFEESPRQATIQEGMAPVVIGLAASGTYRIAWLSFGGGIGLLIALAVFRLLLWRHINPAMFVAIGGIVYLVGPHVISSSR
jgi:F0F1-type ATP synthase assembly protein I